MIPAQLDDLDRRLLYVAGYLTSTWDYARWDNGTAHVGSQETPYRDAFSAILVGSQETPYRDVFSAILAEANIVLTDVVRAELHELGVVIPTRL